MIFGGGDKDHSAELLGCVLHSGLQGISTASHYTSAATYQLKNKLCQWFAAEMIVRGEVAAQSCIMVSSITTREEREEKKNGVKLCFKSLSNG